VKGPCDGDRRRSGGLCCLQGGARSMSGSAGRLRVTVERETSGVTLVFPGRAESREFLAAAQAQGGFMIPMDARPQPFATLEVTATDAAGLTFAFRAKVVQISEAAGGWTVAMLLADWDAAKSRELESALDAGPEVAGHEEAAPSEGEGVPVPAAYDAASPVFRIKQLDPSRRMLLAMKADRSERQVLCRDTSPQVLLGLLSNPRIEAEEVLAIVKSNHASTAVLQRVAGERRWMGAAEIRTAVVRNPKTPTPLAVRLLESLPVTELRDLAKMGSIREDVRRAAFRVYTKMTGRG
jgi:hypothetical protein